jgi:hypothetical protein
MESGKLKEFLMAEGILHKLGMPEQANWIGRRGKSFAAIELGDTRKMLQGPSRAFEFTEVKS